MTYNQKTQNYKTNFFSRFRRFYYRLNPPEDLTLMGTAVLVGVATGLGAAIFRYLITGVSWVSYDWFPKTFPMLGHWFILIVPAIGGLLAGLLIHYFASEAKGHGVPEVMMAVALRGGRIRPVVAVVKSLASAFTIGTGGSVGREGPIVQIGSAIGSTVGQKLGLSDDRIRNLVACGAAAGIAATFNAPIAGVLFALEIILGEFGVRYFSTVVVSSVVASVIARLMYGDYPAFVIPSEYGVSNLWEYALYPLLGILAAFVGVAYIRVLYWAEDIFDDWKIIPWLKPMIGGVLLGVMALLYPVVMNIQWDVIPQVFNVGYESIEGALADNLTLKLAIVFLILKLIATSLTLGSGGSGGIFAPGLFMGSMLGAAFGLLVQMIFPHAGISTGAYALVGMGAVFAAAAHAPITAILILFELTGNYRIILPLMLTVVIATFLSRVIMKGESIFTLKLTRRGIRLQSGRDVDVLQGVLVSEVMTQQYYTVQLDMPLAEAWDLINRTHAHSFMVLDEHENLLGILTLSDLERGIQDGLLDSGMVKDVYTGRGRLIVAYPNESVGQVLARMGSRSITRAPVVSADSPHKLIGMIRREDIIRAYNLGLARRSEIRERTTQKQASAGDGVEFAEFLLEEGDNAAGKTLAELGSELPTDCILVSIQRGGHRLIPHGNTVFMVGDLVTAYVENEEESTLRACLKKSQEVVLEAE